MKDLKVTFLNAIKAKCHDCQCQYLDGKSDCENTMCELYSFMPYAKKKPNLEWVRYNPKRVGKVLLADCQSSEAQEMARMKGAKAHPLGTVE